MHPTTQNIPHFFKLLLRLGLCLFLFSTASFSWGQTDIPQQLESIEEENVETIQWAEALDYYQSHPLDLNRAEQEEFLALGLLSEREINLLLEHRKTYGFFVEEDELLVFFSPEKVAVLKPFICVRPIGVGLEAYPLSLATFQKGQHHVMLRTERNLEPQQGFLEPDSTSKAFVGSPFKTYLRYSYQLANRLGFGFTMEKDAGERGVDYLSGHVHWRPRGIVQDVMLGDYGLNLGQGLVAWTGFRMGKSPWAMNVDSKGIPVYAYRSAEENRFFRGGALRLKHRGWEMLAWVSHKKRDATVVGDSVLAVSSFRTSGLHRTQSELAGKDALQETVWGGRLAKEFHRFRLGTQVLQSRLDKALERSEQPYNHFLFEGKVLTNGSVDYRWIGRKWEAFGEFGYSSNGGTAVLNGLKFYSDSRISFNLLGRSISPDYTSFYGRAFTERSSPNNEQGLYLGMTWQPKPFWEFNFYVDHYQHLWLKSDAKAPSDGREYFGQLSYCPREQLSMYWRVKWEEKSLSDSDADGPVVGLVDERLLRLRYHLQYQVSRYVSLNTRLAYSNVRREEENQQGFLLYQDIRWQVPRFPLKFTTRVAYFDTESYQTGFYSYEHDVQYAFSVPVYYQQGMRFYLVARYKPKPWFVLWLKYARTAYAGVESMGSGTDEIQGAKRTNVKAQLEILF